MHSNQEFQTHKPTNLDLNFFPDPSKHHISHVIPFTFASYAKFVDEPYSAPLTCPSDNIIRLDPKGDFPGPSDALESDLTFLHSQLAIRQFKHFRHLAMNFKLFRVIGKRDFKTFTTDLTKHFKSLTSLHLYFDYWNSLGPDGIELLSQKFTKSLCNLKSLTLIFRGFRDQLDESIKQLILLVCRRLKRLENFTLYISENRNESSDLKEFMTHHLSNYLRNLKHLDIQFLGEDSRHRSRQKQINFNKSRYLSNLTSLTLWTSEDLGISETKSDIQFANSAKSLKKPNHLSLHILRSFQKPSCFENLDSRLFNHLKKLRVLQIDMKSGFGSANNIAKIAAAIHGCSQALEHLKFNLKGFMIDSVAQQFSQNFSCVDNNKIAKLEVDISATNASSEPPTIEDDSKHFQLFNSKTLPRLKNLSHLTIKLSSVRFSHGDLKDMGVSITTNLLKLEDINLAFSFIGSITEETAQIFVEEISSGKLKSLKNLSIDFSYCPNISQEAAARLQDFLKSHNAQLKKFMLMATDYQSDSSWSEQENDVDDSDDSDENLTDFLEDDDESCDFENQP